MTLFDKIFRNRSKKFSTDISILITKAVWIFLLLTSTLSTYRLIIIWNSQFDNAFPCNIVSEKVPFHVEQRQNNSKRLVNSNCILEIHICAWTCVLGRLRCVLMISITLYCYERTKLMKKMCARSITIFQIDKSTFPIIYHIRDSYNSRQWVCFFFYCFFYSFISLY